MAGAVESHKKSPASEPLKSGDTAGAEAAGKNRPTPDEYWQRIRKIVAEEFAGLELNPVLTSGYQFSGDEAGPRIGLQIDLPLWNKKRKFEKREQAVQFLQKGAELVQKLEIAIETLDLLKEKSRFLQAIMRQEGVESVDAFFKSEQEIIKYEAFVIQYHRELQGLVNPVTGNAKILSGTDNPRKKIWKILPDKDDLKNQTDEPEE